MGAMGSSFLSVSELIANEIQRCQSKPFEPSIHQSQDDSMPVIVDVKTLDIPNSNKHRKTPRTSTINYGPISIRKRHSVAPTLATGRRSKDAIMEGEEAQKRELRRIKNRQAARNLKQVREKVENDLQTTLKQLETRQHELLVQIESLKSYKELLEQKYYQSKVLYDFIARTPPTFPPEVNMEVQQTLPSCFNCYPQVKEEARSPSPQWQSQFKI